MNDRAHFIRCAKVYLTEARARPHQRRFRVMLQQWAARCRREAMKGQRELFA